MSKLYFYFLLVFSFSVFNAEAQTTLFSEDFESLSETQITTSTSSYPYQIDGSSGCNVSSDDIWSVTSSSWMLGSDCSTCNNKMAYLDNSSGCSQNNTLVVGSFTNTTGAPLTVTISFNYGYNDYDSGDSFEAALYNETTSSTAATLFTLTSDDENASYSDTKVLAVGETYTLRFTFIGLYDYGATVDDILVTYACLTNPVATFTQNCNSDGSYSLDVDITDLSGNALVKITDGSTDLITGISVVGMQTIPGLSGGATYSVSTDGVGCGEVSQILAACPVLQGCESNIVVEPVCTEVPITFPAGTGSVEAEDQNQNVNYGDLSSTPAPAWYYLEIDASGTLAFDISNSNSLDVDWAAWGPFASLTDINSSCSAGTGAFASPIVHDFTADASGVIDLGTVIAGGFYVVLVTNYSERPTDVSFATTATSTATTDCALICGAELVELSPTGVTSATSQCDNGDWTYYAAPSSPTEMLFAIEWAPDGTLSAANSAVKATATVDIVVDAAYTQAVESPAAISSDPEKTYTMKRYWNVNTTGTMDEAVNVKFFYDPAEKSEIETQASNDASSSMNHSLEPFKWFKMDGVNFDPSLHNVNGVSIETPLVELTDVNTGAITESGVLYAQFNGVTNFSGGSGAIGIGSGSTPLPVELINFNASERGNFNELSWTTATEINNSHFVVERSFDGQNFDKIGEVKGNGNSVEKLNYNFIDVNPSALTYYRLNQVDFDGNFEYSTVIRLERRVEGVTIVNVSPSPTSGKTIVQYLASGNSDVNLSIVDVTGRTLRTETIVAQKGQNSLDIDLSAYANGTYFIDLESDYNKDIYRVIKH